jgi:hypothetical protein
MSQNSSNLDADVDRYVSPHEEEGERRRGWSVEIEKVIIQQAFVLNWGALIAVPAFLASSLPKERLLIAAQQPMWLFALGLLTAIAHAWLTSAKYSFAVRDSEASADLWNHIVVEKCVNGSNELANTDPKSQAQMLKTKAHNIRSTGQLFSGLAQLVGFLSFLFFISGCFSFLYALQDSPTAR